MIACCFTFTGCASFTEPMVDPAAVLALNSGPLADAIAAAKPGVPRER